MVGKHEDESIFVFLGLLEIVTGLIDVTLVEVMKTISTRSLNKFELLKFCIRTNIFNLARLILHI